MGSIYLIRHGQASFGADNYDVLSPAGFEQSAALGKHLAHLGIRFDRCVSGELNRQRDTASATLAQIEASSGQQPPVQVDAAFNEFLADEVIRAHLDDLLATEPNAMNVFANAANHRAEFQRLFKQVIHRWVSGKHDKEGLQSWSEFVSSVRSGLDGLLEQASSRDNIAVFTSGGTITALLQLVIGVSPVKAFELNWQIVNTSVSRLKFRGQDVALASFNSHAHLEVLKNPELITYR